MSKCCLCNSSGCCKSCSCAKLGERCTNCNPLNHSRCTNWKARGGNQLKHSTTVTAVSYKKNPRKALSAQTIIDPTATPLETLKKPIKSGVDYQSPTLMDLSINQRSCQDKPLSYSSVVSCSNCHFSPPHFSESLDISNNLNQAQVKKLTPIPVLCKN